MNKHDEEAKKARAEVERYVAQRQQGASPRVLPTFRGYTVDVRLKEFRRVDHPDSLEFVPFDSPKGQRLLKAFAKALRTRA